MTGRRRAACAAAMVLVGTFVGAALVPVTAAAAPVRASVTKPKVDTTALTKQLATYLAKRPGSASVSFDDMTTGQWYTYRPRASYSTASIVKVDILANLLLRHQWAGTPLTKNERTLAQRMIHTSDNEAASALWAKVGGARGVAGVNRTLGLVTTVPSPAFWGRTTTTAADQVRLLRALTGTASVLKKPGRDYLWFLMRHVMPSQRWGVGKISDAHTTAALKNGWAPRHEDDGGWTVNTTGRVTIGGHVVVIAVLSRGNPDMKAGVATVEHLATSVRQAIRSA